MSTLPARPTPPPRDDRPMPAWEIAYLFPPQGQWSEEEYLSLRGNRLVEFSDGNVEVLPMATEIHQLIVAHLYGLLLAFARAHDLGTVLFAPLPIHLRPGKYREPDVFFMRKENAHRRHNDFWEGADLAIEVVSEDDPQRDLSTKRNEYAHAGIPEYWIVDPRRREITVLTLAGDRYEDNGPYRPGQQAPSKLLPGFTVDAAHVFAAGEANR